MPAAERPAKPRPVYLDLLSIRQPLPAIVSILHRASGALLFAAGIPLLLYAAQTSLASAESYAAWKSLFTSPVAKVALLVLGWAYLHHLFAGVRHLLADIDIGVDLVGARRSAAIVFVLALVITAALAMRLW
jgi:succinate dehydrogenase / fumarate reductase cytochrome b subunit